MGWQCSFHVDQATPYTFDFTLHSSSTHSSSAFYDNNFFINSMSSPSSPSLSDYMKAVKIEPDLDSVVSDGIFDYFADLDFVLSPLFDADLDLPSWPFDSDSLDPDYFATYPTEQRINEVFLSFRGEDTRASFISHLYASLVNDGITVFKDDESLARGDYISNSLLRAIEQSQISIVVFSKNYAESRWCLQELQKIMECYRTIGQVVLPVFYDVDPSEVRHQTGQFGLAFQELSNKVTDEECFMKQMHLITDIEDLQRWRDTFPEPEPLQHWREALSEAAGIAGFVILNSRNEREAIKNIVENVTHLLDKTELFIADNPVGIESRVQEIIQLLDHKNDVLLLGIWGMGGIGKTTIAKAIYNEVGRNFEGRSFLAHIREAWGQYAGQVHLQEQLLFDIDKGTKTKIPNIESGKNILKGRLCHKKVLLILDDVNKLHQVKALCGSREWFGPGSRIIITTRDMDILKQSGVDKIYTMKGMDEHESMELFSWHAFKQPSPREDFTELSRDVITYSGGLPLSLEVLGSHLFGKEVTKWKTVLEKLKKIPNDEVQEKLKISYDGLSDDTERDIFLDIACFFIGKDRNDVIHILDGCGLCAENGIYVLVEKSLVTVDDKNKLGMHDLLRDMGREIIRGKSPKEPEERSRLWFHADVLDVLSKESGTKAIEGLALKLPSTNAKCFRAKAFKKMKKLRLLQLAGVQLEGKFEHISKDLRWLCWHGFPLDCIPAKFDQQSLVSIELEKSNVKRVWRKAQVMENLKILNLSHSHSLTHTPDFLNLPNLEKLVLIDCPRLSEVSPTIGYLNKVLLINLQDCISLGNLPRSIYKLKTLKTLILSGCLKIDKLEEDLEQMESLTTLFADKTAITKVPYSIVRSKSIGYISLCNYEGFARNVFPSIILSWMSPISNFSSHIQTFAGMPSFVSLDVANSSSNLLSSISMELSKLKSLWIKCGSGPQLYRDAATILNALDATVSKGLEPIESTSQIRKLNALALIECSNQVQSSGSKCSAGTLLIKMGMSCQVTHILEEIILQTPIEHDGCLLPGNNYPLWLTFDSRGSSVIFEIPQVNGRNLKTVMCHVQYSSPYNITSDSVKNLLVINHTKATIQLYKREVLAPFKDEDWQRVVSNIEPGNKVEVVVVFENRFILKKTTIYLIYDESINKKREYCHASDKNVIVSSGNEITSAARWISPQLESTDEFKQKHKRRKFD